MGRLLFLFAFFCSVVCGRCDQQPIFDASIESIRSPKQFAVLYAFKPEPCLRKEYGGVYQFIDTESSNYADLEVHYVSTDGVPPRIKFYESKEAQTAATVDSSQLSIQDLEKLLQKQIELAERGEKPGQETGLIDKINIGKMSSQEIVKLLNEHNVARGFPKSTSTHFS
eukprot:TRINITY_DN612_c0_g1_i1.p1 TRINITY_DN612_c0_g1~~TRINITY_DN612_c0_g1_i1.p1  ORF type:complete len:169 (-),score=24.00 TRINITY_DN612_c0_g1_i1:148-654(-)